ncbi:cysteine desulfurase family protein [Desulfurivibrio dismutans]|uniref:cysteine desulfurase family protein n=1 Tax=Desulfurivibrio dismutans TaxID=1398908 RepID=UPI0023DA5C0F|nr:cysteine desulfurase family protein [Desulfurivibrio alkaliphilus]MDF1615434.1 cysteine desulfurase family protein [Desulfurivibrio alkaliphilus]
MRRIYLDNNATTPLLPAVVEVMSHCLAEDFGNPSSGHSFGEVARRRVETSRGQVAGLLRCAPDRVVFTSGGSEANCQAIFSAVMARPAGRHLIASTVEHPSVMAPLEFLRRRGYEIELLPVDATGRLDPALLENAIRPDTVLVSLLAANNETGVLWDVAELGGICRDQGVPFHCDAVQLAGKEEIRAEEWPVDYLALAAHKLHGPKGCGALYARRSVPVTPLVMGAGQEAGRRAGTENVAGIAGFGQACELAAAYLADGGRESMEKMGRRLEEGLFQACPEVRINGEGAPRLANTVNVSFEYCSSAQMIQDLDELGFAVSAHAACHSGDLDPSPVLAAMAVPETFRHGTLRISLSRLNTTAEIDALLAVLPKVAQNSRQGFV